MEVVITRDQVAAEYGRVLRYVSSRDMRRVYQRALNRGGDQGRTQVRRSLVAQTGIKYGLINQAVSNKRATSLDLSYSLIAKGRETNLNLFGARQGARGVSAAPWNIRRVFKSTFIVPRFGAKVFKRRAKERGPIKGLFGPNIGREIVREPTVLVWEKVGPFVMRRIDHELMRLFA
jgi:hypothetical protein